ncbi:hypothetical protein AWC32_20565 [Mycobacterium xenopi]|nr:hypothetical protein AWC32_20565 [Mycobacterium xenopi]
MLITVPESDVALLDDAPAVDLAVDNGNQPLWTDPGAGSDTVCEPAHLADRRTDRCAGEVA